MREKSNEPPNRRILRRGDPPQALEDAAALKPLSVFERIPQFDILRLSICMEAPEDGLHYRARTKASRGTMHLEIKSAGHPIEASSSLYLRLELTLEDVLATPLGELITRVCEEIAAREDRISIVALERGRLPLEVVWSN